MNPWAALTTPRETTPVPLEPQGINYQIPRQDTEQTIPMQLVSTGREEQDNIVPTPSLAPNQEERELTVPLGWNTSMNGANREAPVDDTEQPTFQVPLSDVLTGSPLENLQPQGSPCSLQNPLGAPILVNLPTLNQLYQMVSPTFRLEPYLFPLWAW